MDLAARAAVVQPALDGDGLADVLADLVDVCRAWIGPQSEAQSARRPASSPRQQRFESLAAPWRRCSSTGRAIRGDAPARTSARRRSRPSGSPAVAASQSIDALAGHADGRRCGRGCRARASSTRWPEQVSMASTESPIRCAWPKSRQMPSVGASSSLFDQLDQRVGVDSALGITSSASLHADASAASGDSSSRLRRSAPRWLSPGAAVRRRARRGARPAIGTGRAAATSSVGQRLVDRAPCAARSSAPPRLEAVAPRAVRVRSRAIGACTECSVSRVSSSHSASCDGRAPVVVVEMRRASRTARPPRSRARRSRRRCSRSSRSPWKRCVETPNRSQPAHGSRRFYRQLVDQAAEQLAQPAEARVLGEVAPARSRACAACTGCRPGCRASSSGSRTCRAPSGCAAAPSGRSGAGTRGLAGGGAAPRERRGRRRSARRPAASGRSTYESRSSDTRS